MKKIWLNKNYLVKLAGKCTAYLFSFLGFIETFVPLSEIVPKSWPFLCKLLLSFSILIVSWVIFFIICAIWFKKQKRLPIFKVNNNCHVYVQYGDIFSEDEVNNPNERRNIVIPVNRCFDTIVDNDLVSEKSLHGITLKKMYADGIYNENTLNKALLDDLMNRQKLKVDTLTQAEKRKGNLYRFELGTIAEINESDTCTFFFLALSTFNSNLIACTKQEDYVIAMQRLIEYCSERSQGYPIVMPLIGAGLSKTKNDERSMLEFIVKLLKMNKNIINSDVHIVVRNNCEETVSITEL